ncbi:MAG: GGDEF domain-containing protein [Patescibacteria group bacterium]
MAECEHPEEPVDEVVKKSDAAMYRSKKEGRNRVSVFQNGECCGSAMGKAFSSDDSSSERRFDWHSAISRLFVA